MSRRVLCFDLGASGGRAMLAEYSGGKMTLTEVHRFRNRSVQVGGTLYWDILSIYSEIKAGLVKAFRLTDSIESIGIDTWGVDYGILDESGALIGNPVQYRDKRTAGAVRTVEKLIPLSTLYALTGNQIMEINTAFQLTAEKRIRQFAVQYGAAMLNIPDLLAFMLTGSVSSELSVASTTQLFDPQKLDWSYEVIDALGLPHRLFQRIILPGESKGQLREEICRELNIPPVTVTAVCGHDTQCASFAAPAGEKDFIFLSSGTWSLLGTVTDDPIVTEKAYSLNLTNEAGFGGRINVLKNITGLWLVQETKAFLESRGQELSYAALESAARECSGFTAFIDPDAAEFSTAGDMPQRIRDFCLRTGQAVPESIGEVMRTIYLSLAMKYRYALEQISELTGKSYGRIYAVGGGTQDSLLCQLTADVCGVPVSAGPVEATVMGNAAMQLLSVGAIGSPDDIPEIILSSERPGEFAPERSYDNEYEVFTTLSDQRHVL